MKLFLWGVDGPHLPGLVPKLHLAGATILTLAIIALIPFPACASEGESNEEVQETTVSLMDIPCVSKAAASGKLEGWVKLEGQPQAGTSLGTPVPLESADWSAGNDCGLGMAAPTPGFWLSAPLPVDSNLVSLSGAVMGSGPDTLAAFLVWMHEDTVKSLAPFRKITVQDGTRYRFNLSEAPHPDGATAARLLLINSGGTPESACWQSAMISGIASYAPEIRIAANRVGYEPEAPKAFSVSSNFQATEASFILMDADGAEVFRANLEGGRPIQGNGGTAWDDYHYRGDFSPLEQEGSFTLTVSLDACPPVSEEIHIQYNILWDRTLLCALQPFGPCRADDSMAAGALRLWNETGLHPAADAEILWKLARAWSLLRIRFSDDPALKRLEEEVLYGVERVARFVLDNGSAALANPVEQDLLLNALSCVSRVQKGSENIRSAAALLMEARMNTGDKNPWTFYAALDLFAANGQEHYLEYAKQHFPGITLDRVESLLDFENLTDAPITVNLNEAFTAKSEPLLRNADNVYGLPQTLEAPGKGFFIWDGAFREPLLGNTTRVLSAAEIMAQAYRYSARQEYLSFVYDQFNWMLGNNPFGACLVTGALSREPVTPPLLPGAVLHGIGPRDAATDAPLFATTSEDARWDSTHGFSLRNNASYIAAMAQLKRIPTLRPKN